MVMLNSTLNPILQTAIADVIARLNVFAQDPLFTEKMSFVFGGDVSVTPRRFLNLLQSLPKIEVLENELQGALGAFSAQKNTIYLSANLLTSGSSKQLTAVVIEEVGHYLDSRLNKVDTQGDEGELFSAVVRGINLSPIELTRIQNENDQTQIVLDGKLLAVEQTTIPSFYAWEETSFTLSSSTPQILPWWGDSYQISGDNVVFSGNLLPWHQGRLHNNKDIFLWNSKNINFLYEIGGRHSDPYPPDFDFFTQDADPNDYAPNISGDNIVWYIDDFNSTKLNFWDSKNNIGVEIASFVSNTYLPAQISGNNVVWVGNHDNNNEIYFWNGSTTIQLTNNSTDDMTPKVSGNNVAWLGFDGNDYEVYFWNGSTTTQVTKNSTHDGGLQLSGNNVVWSGFDGNDYEIYLWDQNKVIQLTNNSVHDYLFDQKTISGNNIAWKSQYYDHPFGHPFDIYLWNGITTKKLNDQPDSSPLETMWAEVSGGNVLWGNASEIFFWNGNQTQNVFGWNLFASLSGNNIVFIDAGFNGKTNFLTLKNGGFSTTPETDMIKAEDGDDAVTTTLANLKQNDVINGGSGSDTLVIQGGNNLDTVVIDMKNSTNQLSDFSGASATNFERCDLINFLGTLTFAGSDGNDWVKAGQGNDNLDGGLGADQLWGSLGNDTYILDSIRDVVTENLNEGKDLVQSTVNTTLTNNVEDLTLFGTANINGTGNNSDNTLTGNAGNNLLKGLNGNDTLSGAAGNDILVGGSGSDRLTGEEGADQFLFGSGSAFKSSNLGVDTLTDFTTNSDKIALSKVTFNALTSPLGTLQSAEFVQINSLSNELSLVGASSVKIVYNVATGNLFYNPDGAIAGLNNGGQFATLSSRPNLSATDFFVQS